MARSLRRERKRDDATSVRVRPVSYDEWLRAPFTERFVRDIDGQPRAFYLRVTPTKPEVRK